MKSANILILSQYFYPDIASTGQLLTELASGLSLKEVQVNVLTAYPTYGKSISAPKKEKYGLINIRRVWCTKIDKNKKLGQILNSVTFFISAFFHLFFSGSKSPILIVSNPPFLPFTGVLMKILKGRKYIYLVHDVFPEKAIKLNYLKEGSLLSKIWKWMDKKILKRASSVIVLSSSMKRILEEKFKQSNINPDKITIIHNWADGLFIKPIENTNNGFIKSNKLEDKFIIQYSGNLGASYELEFIVEAANKMKDEKDILFLFIGNGVKKQKLEGMVRDYGLSNVQFLPYQKKEMLPYSLTASAVSIVTYDDKLDGLLMPSKLYTILASGRPVLAVCKEDSEVGDIVKKAECGFLIENNNIDIFIDRITELKSNNELRCRLGINSRKYFENHFTFEHSLEGYLTCIKNLQITVNDR